MIRRRSNHPRRRSCATTFGPVFRARSSASPCVRPSPVVRSERSSSSPSFTAASTTAGDTRMLWSFAFGAGGDAGGVPAACGLQRCVCHVGRLHLRHSDVRWFRGSVPQYRSGARVSHAVTSEELLPISSSIRPSGSEKLSYFAHYRQALVERT